MHATRARAGTLGDRQLRLFLALLKTGNLCHAAAGLGISASSGRRELARLRLVFDGPRQASTAEPPGHTARPSYFNSKRSRFITLVHAATKSRRNFSFASSWA